MRGRRAEKAYVIGNVAFVQNPIAHGYWIRTDRSVLVAPCSACEAKVGDPCLGRSGPTSTTHFVRRDEAKNKPIKLKCGIGMEIVLRDLKGRE
jgi:hypothetical protein